ncbi:MAG: hypothetical protein OHK006_00450 [Thermodesulfovibrionales bacterium]
MAETEHPQLSLDFAGKNDTIKVMDTEELLMKGISHLKGQNALAALSAFEKAFQLAKTPLIQSYYGVCIALERGQIREAIQLCREALDRAPDNPVCYLNLGRTYLKAGRKSEAIDMFRKGLGKGDSPEIRNILDDLGIRQRPVLPFLPRTHFANKYLGLFLSRIGMR